MGLFNRFYGKFAEDNTVAYLRKKHYKILERNYTCRAGEIDIIAKHGDVYVFVEVKKRANSKVGRPEEYVTYSKQKKIISCAQMYIYINKLEDEKFRFDVVAITGEEIEHIINAFDVTN